MTTHRIGRTTAALAAFLGLPLAALAADPAATDALTYREQLLLAALALSALAMLAALVSMVLTRRRYKKRLAEHTQELRKAFADAYVGMRDNAIDVGRVRDAERVLGRIIDDLEHFV